MLERQEEFADPHLRTNQYAAVMNENEELAGFAQFFTMRGVTRLGLGMRPDLCGKGHGLDFVEAIVAEAKQRAPLNEIDLEVFPWNIRAIKVYEQAGFVIDDTYKRMTTSGLASFHCMVYK